MKPFKWTKSHEVYVPELDAEHRELFRLAAEAHRAVTNGAEATVVYPMLQDIAEEIARHFAHEERLMERFVYPLREWHRRQHRGALKSASGLLRQLEGGRSEAAAEFLDFLATWLRGHVPVTDRMMAAHVRAVRHAVAARAS